MRSSIYNTVPRAYPVVNSELVIAVRVISLMTMMMIIIVITDGETESKRRSCITGQDPPGNRIHPRWFQ